HQQSSTPGERMGVTSMGVVRVIFVRIMCMIMRWRDSRALAELISQSQRYQPHHTKEGEACKSLVDVVIQRAIGNAPIKKHASAQEQNCLEKTLKTFRLHQSHRLKSNIQIPKDADEK